MSRFEQEEWKAIPDTDEQYLISSHGRLFSVKSNKVLKTYLRPTGYINAHYVACGREVNIGVHRLVAQAFIPNPLELPQVNHKDGDKLNNNVDNLEWVTCRENIQHAINTGLRARDVGCHTNEHMERLHKLGAKACSKPVIRDDGVIYQSAAAAARAMGGKSYCSIAEVCRHKRSRHTAYGHGWEWYEQEG
jgi:hypothetical protein